jgi:hypothetical protein
VEKRTLLSRVGWFLLLLPRGIFGHPRHPILRLRILLPALMRSSRGLWSEPMPEEVLQCWCVSVTESLVSANIPTQCMSFRHMDRGSLDPWNRGRGFRGGDVSNRCLRCMWHMWL